MEFDERVEEDDHRTEFPEAAGFPDASGRSTSVPIEQLKTHLQIRAQGIDPNHVRRLADAYDLPPILVHGPTMTVIDGLHRLTLARHRGETQVAVTFVHGGEFDLIALAVRSNSVHGLPLTMEDRRSAVRRLLALRPEWSDRRLGRATGVSPGLVSKLRVSLGPETPASGLRLGQDGKVRPLSAGEGRLRVAALLADGSQIPVRAVAAAAGVSVATAQDVRNRLSRGIDPLPAKVQRQLEQAAPPAEEGTEPDAEPAGGPAGRPRAGEPLVRVPSSGPVSGGPESCSESASLNEFDDFLQALRGDPSVRSTEAGRDLLRVLAGSRHSVHALSRLASFLPPHRRETVACLARSLAGAWTRVAQELDHQQRYPRAGEAGRERPSKVS